MWIAAAGRGCDYFDRRRTALACPLELVVCGIIAMRAADSPPCETG
jgi:hypothetical protein